MRHRGACVQKGGVGRLSDVTELACIHPVLGGVCVGGEEGGGAGGEVGDTSPLQEPLGPISCLPLKQRGLISWISSDPKEKQSVLGSQHQALLANRLA